MKVVEGVHVGGGGLADDPGEDVVALMAAGRGATGGLVVGVGEEVLFFLPEVREFITRHTAYNKHDTGWAKGAPSFFFFFFRCQLYWRNRFFHKKD